MQAFSDNLILSLIAMTATAEVVALNLEARDFPLLRIGRSG